mgnify:CR=1 FL=1
MKNQRSKKFILWFSEISKEDVALVGGKNASLGEMFSRVSKKGVRIPNGFAITSAAYWHYLRFNGIDKKLKEIFKRLNPKSIKSLKETGKTARALILKGRFPPDLQNEILESYHRLSKEYGEKDIHVAVRSSATAEDLAMASFAGQHESYINIYGDKSLLKAIKNCIASLFTDRAISYREDKGFDHLKIALSVGILKMVRSDLASSGVMFSLDTETGFSKVVLIDSIYGQGEMIVKGKITPDKFYVFKPTLSKGYKSIIVKELGRKDRKLVYKKSGGLKEVKVPRKYQTEFSLTDKEILTLAKWAVILEKYYGCPQDIEWAKDGKTNQLFIVQSRPETVFSQRKDQFYEEYKVKAAKKPILKGIAVGEKLGQGKVRIIKDISKISEFRQGEVLVTKMTDPDWVSVFPLASAIVTEEGGRTCHAAIVSRELGIPCVVGTGKATKVLKNGKEVTVDCTGGEGKIFSGRVPFEVKRYNLKKIPQLETKIMLNIGSPESAYKYSFLPVEGVGLARMEFILAEKIKVHPLALIYYSQLKKRARGEAKIKGIIKKIDAVTVGYKNKKDYFVKELAEGISQISSAFYPKPVIVRFSDFKTNEYRQLIGGELFEPEEANPMLGWRGASRYCTSEYRPAFAMECEAIKRARDVFGLKNIWTMIPFCRTIPEAKKVLQIMKENGLRKGKEGLKVIVMCEIPSNVVLADKFLEIFDGFSIGSNDLTQLVLGRDRDSAALATVGDERNEAVKEMIKRAIRACRKAKRYSGICGEAPSNFPEFAEFLIKEKIESISLSPGAVIKTIMNISKKNA